MIKLIRHLIFLNVIINPNHAIAQIGNALVLDGCSNYLEVSENDLLDYNETLSIECWIQPNCEDGNNIILSKQWCQNQYGYYLSVNDGRLFWSYSFTGECGSPNTYRTINTEIFTDQFTHVAVVHTLTDIKLFINGNEVDAEQSQGVFGEINNSSEPFRIGAYKNDSQIMTNHFSGLIDEIRVWNIALNEAQIQQNKDIPLQGDETGLVLYLNMEQSGQGNSLVLENQSTFGTLFNATPIGFTSYSPYIINHQEYDENIISLGADIIDCSLPTSISIPSGNYKSIQWNNGSSSNEINISNPGLYSIVVETELCKFYYDTIQIDLSDVSVISNEYLICEGDSISINGIDYFQEGLFLDTLLSSGVDCDTILEISLSVIPTSYNNLQIEICPNSTVTYEGEELEPGSSTSFVYVNTNGCDSILTIEVLPTLTLTEELFFSACEGTQIDYNGSILYPNSSNEFIYISTEGCDSIVTVNVELIPTNTSFLGEDTIVCSSSFFLYSLENNTIWNNEVESNSIEVTTSGVYNAMYIDSIGCMHSDTIQIEFVESNLYIPNAFSPNNDGFNDCFKPFFPNNSEIDFYNFSIYSRWGEKIFETTNINECWNGSFKGKTMNTGVFVWVIELNNNICNKSELLKGDVTLIK